MTINTGALLFFGPIDAGTLTVGTVFTVIDNTAATRIGGTFSNIADGGTVTVGSSHAHGRTVTQASSLSRARLAARSEQPGGQE
ncbi:MAG: hypothetical protein H0X34_15085 [Chthoniobacterales bacterium]|nr:hypothetical protein [Chthoniobacterales bacterium]